MFKPTKIQGLAQALLTSVATHILLYGGSRSGKTFWLCRTIAVRAIKAPGSRHAIIRFRFNHLKQAIIFDTWPKMMQICFPQIPYDLNKSDFVFRFPNGSEVWFGGLDDKERVEKILGNEYATMYFNECTQLSWKAITTALTRLAQRTSLVNKAYYDCNPPTKRHWLYLLFKLFLIPDTREPIKKPEKYACLKMNPADNAENISEDYLDLLDELPARQRKRFKDGDFAEDVEGALWQDEWIARNRIRGEELPELVKVVVAVDPAASDNKKSAEHGIVVVGVDAVGHGYVLGDFTLKGSPKDWGKKAIALYNHFEANCIVIEVNQGGDMAREVIKNLDESIMIVAVHATKGKITRAEPISALYENDKVSHVGMFAELEDQMTTYTGEIGEESPDRMDALVWGLTYVMMRQKANQQTDALPITTGGGATF